MTGEDDKSNKSNKMETRQKKKVVKSPVKNSATQNEGEVGHDYCPCKEYLSGELSVACENCGRYWHLCCVGLRGLTEQMVKLLENWQCQDCYQCPHSYLDKSQSVPSSSECGTIKVMVRDELKAIQPVIRVTVENAVRNMLNNSVCSKEDVKEVVKSYAEVTEQSQKKAIQHAAAANSSKVVVETVVRKLDADKVEREKRRSYVVVLSAPEPSKDSSVDQKKAKDNEFCTSVLKIPLMSQILTFVDHSSSGLKMKGWLKTGLKMGKATRQKVAIGSTKIYAQLTGKQIFWQEKREGRGWRRRRKTNISQYILYKCKWTLQQA